jgi:hypothetical protein
VWKVVETKFEVNDPENPTVAEEVLLQNNGTALSAIHDALDERTFEQIKNTEIAHDAWKKLEESFEGTQVMKGAKAYILKEKFASFKVKEDKSVPEMFHRLQVLVNDLKALGGEVKDKDFSHKFLRFLPSRFGTLVTILVRSGLDTMIPNQVLGDVMTDDTYRDDDEKEEKKEKKDEKKDEKKSVVFKATSSKGKAKQDTSIEDDDSSVDEMDDEKMTLFVKRFDKFMVKKGYCARSKKSSSKSNDDARRCFKCDSKDHLVAQCPYKSENEDDDKKGKKTYKKEKNEKKDKMTFKKKKKKKKGGSYVVT